MSKTIAIAIAIELAIALSVAAFVYYISSLWNGEAFCGATIAFATYLCMRAQ